MTKASRPQLHVPDAAGAAFKQVPPEPEVRQAIREASLHAADMACHCRPMDRHRLEALADDVLRGLSLPDAYRGFAMVALGTAFWRERFAATPFARRLLLLPHCLHRKDVCHGTYDAAGLACAGCGACAIHDIQTEAAALGYQVLVAEGTPAVVRLLAERPIQAILGVACLDSLDKCFQMVAGLDLPYAGLPLLKNGCVDTTFEVGLLREMMHAASTVEARTPEPSYSSLLAIAETLFDRDELRRLLGSHLVWSPASNGEADASGPVRRTEEIALEWLRRGGKRLRPFITLASCDAMRRSADRSDHPGDGDRVPEFFDSERRVALAMELFHKASLVHDDVEDNDDLRYGEPTIHARYGAATAINTGDYLVGLGYRLVASQAPVLGAECVTDILAALGEAHVKLCRGQGAELLLARGEVAPGHPGDVLTVYALKTSPAFHAAVVIGMRLAGATAGDSRDVAAFCRHMGVAYQILDDLADLDPGRKGDQPAGQDVVGHRPTVLWALAHEAGFGGELEDLFQQASTLDAEEAARRARRLYDSCGALDKARGLVTKCHTRARQAAERTEPPAMRDLLTYLLSMVLSRQEAILGI
jgi:geranylgeranyl pyrophosphate synthase